jgi:hypothetical protein
VQSCKDDAGNDATCAKSLKRYTTDAIKPAAIAYSAGTDVVVRGIYGKIRTVAGDAGEVTVTFEPFDYRAYDAEAAARDELTNDFDYSFEETEEGIVATTDRHDSKTGLGADVTVFLPPEFSGALVLANASDGPVNPGDIAAQFVGEAKSVDVSTAHLGACTVAGAASVVSTRAHCDGVIKASGVTDDVDIASTGLSGDVSVVFGAIDDGAVGGDITNEDGNVTVDFPSGASFSVQAQASAGSVEASPLDAVCAVAGTAKTARSYTCGDGGPTYVVTAGTDSVGDSSVALKF